MTYGQNQQVAVASYSHHHAVAAHDLKRCGSLKVPGGRASPSGVMEVTEQRPIPAMPSLAAVDGPFMAIGGSFWWKMA